MILKQCIKYYQQHWALRNVDSYQENNQIQSADVLFLEAELKANDSELISRDGCRCNMRTIYRNRLQNNITVAQAIATSNILDLRNNYLYPEEAVRRIYRELFLDENRFLYIMTGDVKSYKNGFSNTQKRILSCLISLTHQGYSVKQPNLHDDGQFLIVPETIKSRKRNASAM